VKRVDMYTRVSHMALAVAVLLAGALVAVELTDRPSRASELEGVAIWRWEEQGPPDRRDAPDGASQARVGGGLAALRLVCEGVEPGAAKHIEVLVNGTPAANLGYGAAWIGVGHGDLVELRWRQDDREVPWEPWESPREDGSISAVVSVDAAIGGPRKPAVGTEVVVTPGRVTDLGNILM
jgi:hypothetical protein